MLLFFFFVNPHLTFYSIQHSLDYHRFSGSLQKSKLLTPSPNANVFYLIVSVYILRRVLLINISPHHISSELLDELITANAVV